MSERQDGVTSQLMITKSRFGVGHRYQRHYRSVSNDCFTDVNWLTEHSAHN